MRKDILFVTWHLKEELYQKMSSLLDANVIPINLTPYPHYFLGVLTSTWGNIEWIVHIDEDTFLFDLEEFYELIDYMKSNNFDVAGVPDGGVIKTRANNPLSINPFFSIYRYKKVRNILLNSHPLDFKCDDLIQKHLPSHLFKKGLPYDVLKNNESYYPFFFKLLRDGAKFLYLNGEVYDSDYTSTYLLNHKNNPFLIHTWFARRYIEGKGEGFYPLHDYKSADTEYNSYRINDIFEKHKTRELGLKTYQKQKVDS